MKSKLLLSQQVLIALSVVFFLLIFPHSIGGDGFVRYENFLKFLHDGQLRPMVYSYVGPLFSTPFYAIGLIYKDSFWWLSRFNCFICLGAAGLLWRAFRASWTREQGLLFVLLFLCGTMMPRHVVDYYSEVFTACGVSLAIVFFLKERFWPALALISVATWNTPGTLVASCMVFGFFLWRERKLRYILGPILCAAGIFLENHIKYGYWFPTEYLHVTGDKNLLPYSAGPGFCYPLLFGLISVFFSSGKGLLFFTPGILSVFLPNFFRKDLVGSFLQVGLFYFAGLLLIFSRWWCWSGDWFWGPRFYLFVSVWAAIALSYSWPIVRESARRLSFWTLITALSLWVGCEGILYGQDFLEDCFRQPGTNFMCSYVPEFSTLWRVFVVMPTPHGRKIAILLFFILVAMAVLWVPVAELSALLCLRLRKEWQRIVRYQEWKF